MDEVGVARVDRRRARAGGTTARSALAVAVLVTMVAGLLAGCGSDEPAATRPGREATKDLQSPGWDLEIRVKLKNDTRRPVEVGAFDETGEEAGQTYISASPAGAKRSIGSIVVPEATTKGAGTADIFIQARATDGNPRVVSQVRVPPSRDYPGQHIRVVLPTLQIGIVTTYFWQKSNCKYNEYKYRTYCDYERRAQVEITTKNREGDPAPLDHILSCLDPTSLPKWDSQVGPSTAPTSARWAADSKLKPDPKTAPIDTIDVEFRNATEVAEGACNSPTDRQGLGYTLPGFSLSTGQGTDAGDGMQLPGIVLKDAVMPGVDLSWARLSSSRFNGAGHSNLSYADLDHTDLTKANLEDANLTGATFDGATVDGLILTGATLFGVDLSKTTGTLGDVSGIRMCHTKLPQYLVEELGGDYQPDADCQAKLQGGVGSQPGYDGLLVDTGSAVPLVLVATGKVGCRAVSGAGSFQGIRLPDCTVQYVSDLLPGGAGSVMDYISAGSMRSGFGTLDLRSEAIYGWDHAVCLKTMSTATEICPDRYREPKGAS